MGRATRFFSRGEDIAMRKARFLIAFLLVLADGVGVEAHADIKVGNIPNQDFGTWDPASGSVSMTSDFCVVSVLGKVQSSTIVTPYAARVGNRDAVPFEMFALGPLSDVISVTVTHVDLVTMTPEVLTPDVYTAQTKTGALNNCPSGLNARVRTDINVMDLTSTPSGNYRARLRFTALGGDGSQTGSKNYQADIVIPELVQISDMDPVNLGTFDGVSNLIGVDGLCVYRNQAAGAYTIEGTGDGAGNAFEIASAGDVLPYQVEYDDGTGFVTLTAGAPPANHINADTTAPDCGGGTTADLRVTVLATDMVSAPPGTYTGTLTLTVAPI